jgi:hypothetical protein
MQPTGEPDAVAKERAPASDKLYIDGKLVGAVDMPQHRPNVSSMEGVTCGYDAGSVMALNAYRVMGFAFTGPPNV